MCARLATLCTAREGSRRSLITITASVERVGPLKERLIHHRVIRGQRHSAQTPRYGPRTHVQKLRHMLVKALEGNGAKALEGALIMLRY